MEKSKGKMPDRASEDYNEKMIELLESELESLRKERDQVMRVPESLVPKVKSLIEKHRLKRKNTK